MPDITITIPSPILTGSAYFKVRYRLLPGGAFSGYQNRTNAPFTLTGLTAGNYELEVIYVKEDGTECAATYQYFEVKPEFTCVNFTMQIVHAGNGLFNLEITYTQPPVSPPCGWRIDYNNGNGLKSIHYSTLPAANVIKIPVANWATYVKIVALLCNGDEKMCGEADVTAIDVPCVPFANVRGQINYVPGSNWQYQIELKFDQSNPGTDFHDIIYEQLGVPANPNQQLHKGVIYVPQTIPVYNNPRIIWHVNPVPTTNEIIQFRVKTRDKCNVWHTIIITYP